MDSVSPDALARLAAMQRPEDSRAGGSGWTYDAGAMLDAVTADLAAQGIRITDKPPKSQSDGGRLWELTGCPYSDDHDDSVFLRQFDDGGVHVGCHHDRCQGKTIKNAPERFPLTLAIRATQPLGSGPVPMNGRRVQGDTGTPPGDDAPEPMAPAPVWPSGILPDGLERYASGQAASIGVPVDMVAVPLLVFAGGVIGNMIRLQLKPAWNVFPTLWAGVIGDPAGKKSPTLDAAQWPVNKLQDVLYDRWQEAKAEWEADVDDKGKPKGFPPKLEHVFTTDATMEALVRILSESRGVSIVKDELSGFIGGMNKYRSGKGDDRDNYLSLWTGTRIKSDRVSGGTLYATHPVAGVYGGIQPDRAGDLHNRDGTRDGMVERFLLYRPDVVRTGWNDDTVDLDSVNDAATLYAELRGFAPPINADRITVKMHPDAKREWVRWYDLNDTAVGSVSGLRQGFYGKLDSQLARVALILHCLHNPGDPARMIGLETIQAAIEVAEFFRGHLDRVLPLIGDRSTGAPVGLEARVLRYLRLADIQGSAGWVHRSAVYARLRNVSADALSDALDNLKRRGMIENRTLNTATNTAEQWRIAEQIRSSDSRNSQDSPRCARNRPNPANTTNLKNGGASNNVTPLRPTGTDGPRPGEVEV